MAVQYTENGKWYGSALKVLPYSFYGLNLLIRALQKKALETKKGINAANVMPLLLYG